MLLEREPHPGPQPGSVSCKLCGLGQPQISLCLGFSIVKETPQGLTVVPGPLHSDSLPRVWVVGSPQVLRTSPPSLGPKPPLNRCWNLQVSLTLLGRKVWGRTGGLFLIWGGVWRRLPDPRWPAIPALPALGWGSPGAPLVALVPGQPLAQLSCPAIQLAVWCPGEGQMVAQSGLG